MKTNPTNHRGTLVMVTIASALLIFIGCGTGSNQSRTSDQGTEMTSDQLGPPSHIQSEPLSTEHPSSNTGGVSGMGSNTNLNAPPPVPPEPTESFAPTSSTPTEAPAPMIVQATPPPVVAPPPPPAIPVIAPPPPMPEPVPVHEVTKKE